MDDIASLTHQRCKLRAAEWGDMSGFDVFHVLIFIIRVKLDTQAIHESVADASVIYSMSANVHQKAEFAFLFYSIFAISNRH